MPLARLLVLSTLLVACTGGGGDSRPSDAGSSDDAGQSSDGGALPDASGPDAGSAENCQAQTIEGCPEPCVTEVGAYWNGESCQPILCCCEGPDCQETYETIEACLSARSQCHNCPDPGDPLVDYVSTDPLECAAIDFDCFTQGATAFDDECGCGCIREPGAEGALCGQSAGGLTCDDGLACCYPCGIPGCDFSCTPACDANQPGCADGCMLAP